MAFRTLRPAPVPTARTVGRPSVAPARRVVAKVSWNATVFVQAKGNKQPLVAPRRLASASAALVHAPSQARGLVRVEAARERTTRGAGGAWDWGARRETCTPASGGGEGVAGAPAPRVAVHCPRLPQPARGVGVGVLV